MDFVPHAFIKRVTNTLFAAARAELISTTLGQWSSIPAVFSEYVLILRVDSESGEIRSVLRPICQEKQVHLSQLLSSWKSHTCAIVSLYVWYDLEDEDVECSPLMPSRLPRSSPTGVEEWNRCTSILPGMFELMNFPHIWPILDAVTAVGDVSVYRSGGSLIVSHCVRWAQQGLAEMWIAAMDDAFSVSREFERAVMPLVIRGHVRHFAVFCERRHEEFYKKLVRSAMHGSRAEKFRFIRMHKKFASIMDFFTREMALVACNHRFRRFRDSNGNEVVFMLDDGEEDKFMVIYNTKQNPSYDFESFESRT